MGAYLTLHLTAACQNTAVAATAVEPALQVPQPTLGAPITLQRVGFIDFGPIDESSGLAASRRWPGIYWTHNDSGDCARIFAVTAQGQVVGPEWRQEGTYAGVQVPNALNHDWEDIACSPDGTLYIADTGNNANSRRDLGVYILPEPDPRVQAKARSTGFIPFVFPDQKAFPPEERNFDCEALFYADGTLWVLSKHRSDTRTKLYRFPALTPGVSQTLELIDSFEIGGMVTGADCSDDGRKLAVLTYNALWLFESAEPGRWFEGRVSWLPFWNGKICEGVCFQKGGLLISNENRELFRVEFRDFIPYRGARVATQGL
jgi:hypothetical protein